VRAAPRLGYRQRAKHFPPTNLGQVRCLLSLVAVARNDCADQSGKEENVSRVEVATRDLLMRDSQRYVVESRAAVPSLDHGGKHAQLAELAYQRGGQIFIPIARLIGGKQFTSREIPQGRLQQLLLGRERKVHASPSEGNHAAD